MKTTLQGPRSDRADLPEPAGASEPDWRSAVVYQIYPRSFADTDGDGIGDLRGVADRLDYLAHLGVDVIWLSPVYASPQDDNGYDISDYRAIDPVFGDLSDFDELVTRVHACGMKLVMDLVVNHTSDEHDWFRDSRSSASAAKRDWYWWRRPRPGFVGGEPGAEPNNWGSFFGGSAWQYDPDSGEYYLHLFSAKQPDLNWENHEVRDAVYDMMSWWLDRGVDGFRMDVINLISKVPALPDGERAPGAAWGDGFLHYAQGPRIHEFLREMHERVFDSRPGRFLTVGEMPGVPVEQAREFTDPRRKELDMVFQFEHVDIDHGVGGKWDPVPFSVRALKGSLGRWQRALADVGWNSLYWNNHDQPRVVSRFGDDTEWWYESATALATTLHMMRGTPFIYQGEELGMTSAHFSCVDEYRDIESLVYAREAAANGVSEEARLIALQRTSRDNARTPMQWDATPNAGFTSGTPWIGVNENYRRINARAQEHDPTSVLAHYRHLIELRHRLPVVVHGTFEMLLDDHPQMFAYRRDLDDERMIVLVNLSGEPAAYRVSEVLPGSNASSDTGGSIESGFRALSDNYVPRRSARARGIDGGLAPWQALILVATSS